MACKRYGMNAWHFVFFAGALVSQSVASANSSEVLSICQISAQPLMFDQKENLIWVEYHPTVSGTEWTGGMMCPLVNVSVRLGSGVQISNWAKKVIGWTDSRKGRADLLLRGVFHWKAGALCDAKEACNLGEIVVGQVVDAKVVTYGDKIVD